MSATNNSALARRRFSRTEVITLLKTAVKLREPRFFRETALAWLASFPGDLPVELLYAQGLIRFGQPQQAKPILEQLSMTDPEFLEAVESLLDVQSTQSNSPKTRRWYRKQTPENYLTLGWVLALGGTPNSIKGQANSKNFGEIKSIVAASKTHAKIRAMVKKNNLAGAESGVHLLLANDPIEPLTAVTHLSIIKGQIEQGTLPADTLIDLANHYHQKWPSCVQFSLQLADGMMGGGNADAAVNLLHQAVVQDITGQVAGRLWGARHKYRTLWPQKLELTLEVQVPASIAATYGWNRLTAGELIRTDIGHSSVTHPAFVDPGDPKPSDEPAEEIELTAEDEELLSIKSELEQISIQIKKPEITKTDGRFPVYVVMTTHAGIRDRYGEQEADLIESELQGLVGTINNYKDWSSVLFFADEGIYWQERSYPLKRDPVPQNDPWGLKLALSDLDTELANRGERIGAVLIVGGPAIVPFHHLPNPVDDDDDDVPSDNPYGTLDENYFILEWPVGRLPDDGHPGKAKPENLLHLLEVIRTKHLEIQSNLRRSSSISRIFESLFGWIIGRFQSTGFLRSSFGYTAAIWKQASVKVFRPIGEPRSLQISPPAGIPKSNSRHRQGSPLPSARLGYFNLHGLVDAVEWYGQRDPTDPLPNTEYSPEYDYPIAVKPEDIVNSGKAPQIVFSEACYGAHIFKRSVEEALALKFLQSGTHAVVGSTSTSYGSVTAPLIAADYLGHTFWKYLKNGYQTGEALRLAKIDLAREMHVRQGYLDGEDQKTLISFVLFGDPLAYPEGWNVKPKTIQRTAEPDVTVKAICDRNHDDQQPEPIPEDMLTFVKSVVHQYLPGMNDANVQMSYEHIICVGDRCRPVYSAKSQNESIQTENPHPMKIPSRKVITLSKHIDSSNLIHKHFARLTIDNTGKLVKLVVSR